MEMRCDWCWSSYWDDWFAGRNTDLAGGGNHGSAPRFHGIEWDGADEAGTGSVFRPCISVSRSAWRSDQDAVVGSRRFMFVREEIGTRTIHLAAGDERRGFVEPGAAIDAAGGDRLAPAAAYVEAGDIGVDALWITALIFF
jgi:hypothetical protein